jgi:hypothetical protein
MFGIQHERPIEREATQLVGIGTKFGAVERILIKVTYLNLM